MAAKTLHGDDPHHERLLPLWRHRHPYLFWPSFLLIWSYRKLQRAIIIIFAPWPSMHDPIKSLLNVQNKELADKLTEKWTQAKLGELQYVGLTSGLVTSTIAAAFSWYSVPNDPWSTKACWMSALLFSLTAISLAAQQTIGLNRLYSCEDGLLKIRRLLGETNSRFESHSRTHEAEDRSDIDYRVKIKSSQLWTWQTPIMLSNFSILLFIIGLLVAIFVRATAAYGDLSKTDTKIAVFFGCAALFTGTNYIICWVTLNRGSSLAKVQPQPP